MSELFGFDDKATPLMPEELEGLIPTHITQRSELNELEQANIDEADRWAFARKRDIISERFLRGLHRRMFKRVWRWAGQYRASERKLGIESYRIEPELRQLMNDARYWVEHRSYPPDELAVRLHHRLVIIHPFANGNGRWSRLASDLLIVQLGRERGRICSQPATFGVSTSMPSTPPIIMTFLGYWHLRDRKIQDRIRVMNEAAKGQKGPALTLS
jgi:Fic-DOC domain mobile mystery protein B